MTGILRTWICIAPAFVAFSPGLACESSSRIISCDNPAAGDATTSLSVLMAKQTGFAEASSARQSALYLPFPLGSRFRAEKQRQIPMLGESLCTSGRRDFRFPGPDTRTEAQTLQSNVRQQDSQLKPLFEKACVR